MKILKNIRNSACKAKKSDYFANSLSWTLYNLHKERFPMYYWVWVWKYSGTMWKN